MTRDSPTDGALRAEIAVLARDFAALADDVQAGAPARWRGIAASPRGRSLAST